MVRDEDTNVSIWMKENIRVKEGAKNKRWHGKWDVEKKRKGGRVRARERERMIDLRFTPLSHLARSFSTQKA